MRILANYGYKSNGDTYSVTFETMGDVEKEQANATVDELFRLARSAVQRQIHRPIVSDSSPSAPLTVEKPKTEETRVDSEKNHNDGKTENEGNNGQKKPPTIKDPSLPASEKQMTLIKRLAREKRGKEEKLPKLTDLTMGQASAMIDHLRAR